MASDFHVINDRLMVLIGNDRCPKFGNLLIKLTLSAPPKIKQLKNLIRGIERESIKLLFAPFIFKKILKLVD